MGCITGLHHISMKCTPDEYLTVVAFYHDILELPIARTWATGIMFDIGNGYIEVFTNSTEALSKGTIRHFALGTDDVDACVRKVQDAGYTVFLGPKDIVIPSEPAFPARMAFCFGPLGEEIEFFQEKQ